MVIIFDLFLLLVIIFFFSEEVDLERCNFVLIFFIKVVFFIIDWNVLLY